MATRASASPRPRQRLTAIQRQLPALGATAAVALLTSCVYFRTPTVPMPFEEHSATTAADGPAADTLIVLLPGLGDLPSTFVDQGFVDLLQSEVPSADLVAVDAHLGYYRTETIVERLQKDVIGPRAADYDEIWLVGISLGGLGGCTYAEVHPEAVTGMILLAPFLGDEDTIEAIAAAGGLRSWQAPAAATIAAMDPSLERRTLGLWTYLQRYADPATAATMPQMFLAFGEDDGFAAANGMLAEVLPERNWLSRPGGHTWSVWLPLFAELVPLAFDE